MRSRGSPLEMGMGAPWWWSPHTRYITRGGATIFHRKNGGAEGDRTPDLVIANDALSQLSYSPGQINRSSLGSPETQFQGSPYQTKFGYFIEKKDSK